MYLNFLSLGSSLLHTGICDTLGVKKKKNNISVLRRNKTRGCSFTWGISRKLIRPDLSFSRDPAWRCFRLVLMSELMVRSLPRELNLTRRLDRMQSTLLSFLNYMHVFRKLSPVGLGRAHTQQSFLAALDEGGWFGTGALQRTTGVGE